MRLRAPVSSALLLTSVLCACGSHGGPGGPDSGNKLLPCPTVAFGNLTTWTAGQTPTSVAVGDLNSDGVPDIVVANSTDTVLTLLLSNDGGFPGPISHDGGLNPRVVAIADLNGDGKADLLVTESGSFQLGEYLGKGDGTFGAPRFFAESAMDGIAFGNLSGKSNTDVALVDTPGNKVGVRFNVDGGTYVYQGDYGPGANPASVAVADFNGDGRADLAIVGAFGGNVVVMLASPDGGFLSPTPFPLSLATGSSAVVAADFDNNGTIDVAVCNVGPEATAPWGNVDVFLNDGKGKLTLQNTYDVGVAPTAMVAADVNSDGWADLLVTNQGDGTLSALKNAADGGRFGPHQTFTVSGLPASLAVGDFNGDQRPDVAVAGGPNGAAGNVSILYNTCAL